MTDRIRPPRERGRTRLALLALVIILLGSAGSASATTNLEGWLQDDPLIIGNPGGTLQQLRDLGVTRVRLSVRWNTIAPKPTDRKKPTGFNGADPAAYPAANWAPYDAVVRTAAADGIALDFDIVGPDPVWAEGPNGPSGREGGDWEPNDAYLKAYVEALGTRYSGHYTPPGAASPLPRITFWTVWNEPNYGPSLSPQGLPSNLKIEHSPMLYRGILDAAWSSLHRTGHGGDTIVIGELSPRGNPNPLQPKSAFGLYRGMLPIVFVRRLYCLTNRYRLLHGKAASLRGCPTNATASAAFRAQNPALFEASGFSDHPYDRYFPPNVEKQNSPGYASFADLGNLTTALDRSVRAYGSTVRFPIWSTEYGYITSPPKPHYDPYDNPPTYYATQATAAEYMNFAEYLSYKNPRIENYMQYLLADAIPNEGRANGFGGYTSGLEAYGGAPKATYYAYRMPLYLPQTTTSAGGTLEVWGDVRPARFAMLDDPNTPQMVTIQFAPTGGAYTDLATIPILNAYGYYDTHLSFPSSGTVRAKWEYPSDDMKLLPGQYAVSRSVQVTER